MSGTNEKLRAMAKTVNTLIAESAASDEQLDALARALRDAITIMHTARKSAWGDHDRALKRFDHEHREAIELLEEWP